jgi:hypothetical protein
MLEQQKWSSDVKDMLCGYEINIKNAGGGCGSELEKG